MKCPRARFGFWAVVTAALLPVAALSSPYFPLADDWYWDYVGDGGSTAHVEAGGVQVVIKAPAVIRTLVFAGAFSDSVENYWTATEEGDVFLHGFHNFTAGLIRAYDPPILFLDAPLELGKTWSTTYQSHSDLEGTVPIGEPTTIHFQVLAAQDVNVPAGTFFAYEIGQLVPVALPTATGLVGISGERIPAAGTGPNSSYAEAVGEVRFGAFEIFELTAYGAPVSVSPTTWAQTKGRYRGR